MKLKLVALLVGSFFYLSIVHSRNIQPNIIIILADDLGYGDLETYGGWVKTPHLNQLAKQGMLFTDFHSNAPVCSPTRAALLTGRYQQRSGIDGVVYASFKANRHHGLFPSEITFSELFEKQGYETGMFGKWHLGYEKKYNPVHHGFDKFVGYVSGNVDYFSHVDGVGIFDWWHNLEKTEEDGYVTHLITKHAVKFIKQNRNKPFCLYIAHEAPHYPFQGPDDVAIRKVGEPIRQDRSDTAKMKRAYREMVEQLDISVGEVMTALAEEGLSENTFVFFFSDNGALPIGSNGKLSGYKGKLWEGGQRVPAIAYWPGKISAGSENHDLYVGMDVMPSILAMCDIELPSDHSLDGKNFWPEITREKDPAPRQVFWEYRNQQAMRDGYWKLLVTKDKNNEKVGLYNLESDIQEQNNLAAEYPEKVNQMKTAIAEWKKDVEKNATQQPDKSE